MMISNLVQVEPNRIRDSNTPALDCYLLTLWCWKCCMHALTVWRRKIFTNASIDVNCFLFLWLMWSAVYMKNNGVNVTCGLSPIQKVFGDQTEPKWCWTGLSPSQKVWRPDRTEVMLDRRGPGPVPVLTLVCVCGVCLYSLVISWGNDLRAVTGDVPRICWQSTHVANDRMCGSKLTSGMRSAFT